MGAPMLVVSMALYTPVIAALTVAYNPPSRLGRFLCSSFRGSLLSDCSAYIKSSGISHRNWQSLTLTREGEPLLSQRLLWVDHLDARDRYTAGHSAAVAIYARDIAIRMDLAEEETRKVHLAGLVHDIGKIGPPAGLLEKPGALDT